MAVSRAGGIARLVRELNKPRATIDRWMNAQAAPSLLDIAELADVCGVSLEWLARGVERPDTETVNTYSSPDVVEVPILDVRAAAGTGAVNDHEEIADHLPFPREFLKLLGVNPEKVRALHAYGDSMEPTIPDGRLVLVDLADRDVSRPRVFVLRTPDGLRLKRVQRLVDGSLRLLSDNKDLYPPELVSGTDINTIKVIGRAFWTERLL